MIRLFPADPNKHIIDFITAVIDSEHLTLWLKNLEKLSDSSRLLHLAEMKSNMQANNEPAAFLEILELLNNREILQAMNAVILEAQTTGKKVKKSQNYKLLISLITSTH